MIFKWANLQADYEGIKITVAKINKVHCVIYDWCFYLFVTMVWFFAQQFTVGLPHIIANQPTLLDNKYFCLFTEQKTA